MSLNDFPDILPGSLAHRLATVLLADIDMTLSAGEIAERFDVKIGDVAEQLAVALRSNVLTTVMRRGAPNSGVVAQRMYGAGQPLRRIAGQQALSTNWPGRNTKAPEGQGQRAQRRRMPILDVSQLAIETGIELEPPRPRGTTPWNDLFDRLTEPGQSVAVAAGYSGTVKKAVQAYAKRHAGRQFSVGKDPKDADSIRILRRA